MSRKISLQERTASASPTVIINTDRPSEVMHYAQWLTAEKIRSNNISLQEESSKYSEDALRTITLRGKEFRPFAPFRHASSAYKTLTFGQAVALSIILLVLVLGVMFYGVNMVIAMIAVVTLLYLGSLLPDFWLTMRALNRSTEEQIDEAIARALADADWPRYTILCPLYREVAVVPQFVEAMQALGDHADCCVERGL